MSDQQENRNKSYFPLLAAAAPAFALKSVVGDLPKAAIEHGVTNKALGSTRPFSRLLAEGVRGKGLGRMAGGAIGIATAPLFLKGTSLLESDKKGDKARGLGYIAGSTAAYMGAEGFLEKFIQARASGSSPLAAAGKGAFLGAVRSSYKVPMALAAAAGVAAGRHNSDDSNPAMKYVIPIGATAAVGGASRIIEDVADMAHSRAMRNKILSPKGLKHLGASGLGGAAAGAFGGLVLAKIVDALSPHKKKEASLTTVYEASKPLLHFLGEGYGLALGQHVATSAGYGYKPQATAMKKVLGKKFSDWWTANHNQARARHFGIGIQEGLEGKVHHGFRAEVGTNYGVGIGGVSPEVLAQRGMGIKLGNTLRDLSPADREQRLRRIQKFIIDNPNTLKGTQGEANPITVPMLAGISMALGDRPFYSKSTLMPTFQKLYKKVMYSGRGYSEHGLNHNIGKLEKEPGYFKRNLGHAATIAAAAPMHMLAPPLAGHGVISAGKNLVIDTPVVKRALEQTTHGGIRYGLFPNAAQSTSEKFRNLALEQMISPATTASERGIQPLARVLRDNATRDVVQHARDFTQQAFDKVKTRKSRMPANMGDVLKPLGIGSAVGIAGYSGLAHKHKD